MYHELKAALLFAGLSTFEERSAFAQAPRLYTSMQTLGMPDQVVPLAFHRFLGYQRFAACRSDTYQGSFKIGDVQLA